MVPVLVFVILDLVFGVCFGIVLDHGCVIGGGFGIVLGLRLLLGFRLGLALGLGPVLNNYSLK